MAATRPKADELRFVEDVGVFLEQGGMPRIAGRILGWLLICTPPHQRAAELAEVLHASRGSISSMTRLLISSGLVERIHLHGDRRDYYRIRPVGWTELIRERLGVIEGFRQLADRGLAMIPERDRRRRLQELRDLYAWLEDELPRLLDRWERQQRGRST